MNTEEHSGIPLTEIVCKWNTSSEDQTVFGTNIRSITNWAISKTIKNTVFEQYSQRVVSFSVLRNREPVKLVPQDGIVLSTSDMVGEVTFNFDATVQ